MRSILFVERVPGSSRNPGASRTARIASRHRGCSAISAGVEPLRLADVAELERVLDRELLHVSGGKPVARARSPARSVVARLASRYPRARPTTDAAARPVTRRPPRPSGQTIRSQRSPLAGTTTIPAPPRPRQSPPSSSAASRAEHQPLGECAYPSTLNASPIASQTRGDSTMFACAIRRPGARPAGVRRHSSAPVHCAVRPSDDIIPT